MTVRHNVVSREALARLSTSASFVSSGAVSTNRWRHHTSAARSATSDKRHASVEPSTAAMGMFTVVRTEGMLLVEPSRCCRWPEKGGEKRRSYVHSLKLIESSSQRSLLRWAGQRKPSTVDTLPPTSVSSKEQRLVPIATTGGRTVPGRSGSG
jgi:hypothetical protein